MAFTYKVLGQSAPADTNNADLYTVGSGKSAVVSTINVANVSGSAATFRIYVRVAGASAADSNALAKDVTIPANSLSGISLGVTLAATDVLTVRSSVSNALTFQAFGSEVA